MKLKKMLIGLLGLTAVLSLASCGNDVSNTTNITNNNSSVSTPITTKGEKESTSKSDTNKDVTVTFYDGDTLISTLTGKKNEEMTIANPEKEGYDFDGWFMDKECSAKYQSSNFPSSSVSLYAKFVRHFDLYDTDGVIFKGSDNISTFYYEIDVIHSDGDFIVDMCNEDYTLDSSYYAKKVTLYSDKEMKNVAYPDTDFEFGDYYGSQVLKYNGSGIKAGKYYLVLELNDISLAAESYHRLDMYYEYEHYYGHFGECEYEGCDAMATEDFVIVDGLTYSATMTLAPAQHVTFILDGSSITRDKMNVNIAGTRDNTNNVTIDGYDCDDKPVIRGNFDRLGEMGNSEQKKGKISIVIGSSYSNTTPVTISFSISLY